MSAPNASAAVLVPVESVTQFVIRQLLEGKLGVRVTVGDKTYDGYVHNLDFGKGSDHVCAMVHVPELDEEEGAEGYMSLKVWISLDGTVTILPDDLQDA